MGSGEILTVLRGDGGKRSVIGARAWRRHAPFSGAHRARRRLLALFFVRGGPAIAYRGLVLVACLLDHVTTRHLALSTIQTNEGGSLLVSMVTRAERDVASISKLN